MKSWNNISLSWHFVICGRRWRLALTVLQTQGYEVLEWEENLQSLKELGPLRGPSCVLNFTRAFQTAPSSMLPAVFCPQWAHTPITVPTDRQVKLGEVFAG